MFDVKHLFYFTLLHSIAATPQINLYYTDWIGQNEIESDNVRQRNCLRFALNCHNRDSRCELVVFCMSEVPWKFNVEKNDHFPNFTFAQLSEQNVTSQQLYLWSASIDLIEHYQFYLNQLLISDDLVLGSQVFYNCTTPRFGPICQYQLFYHRRDHSFTSDILRQFYRSYGYNPTTLTCYTHLKCNRGPYGSCLDWSEICDGKVDCLDGGQDEEHCWELEINQCKDDEYRCMNGQCIPKSFNVDTSIMYYCVDGSDRRFYSTGTSLFCSGRSEPSFQCEDRICLSGSFTSSCVEKRENLLVAALFSNNDSSVSKECWPAFKRIIDFSNSKILSDEEISQLNKCIQIVKNDCPDLIYFPNVPVLFGEIWFAYKNNDLQHFDSFSAKKLLICYKSSHYDHYFRNISKMLSNNITCIRLEQLLSLPSKLPVSPEFYRLLISELYVDLMKYHLVFNYTSTICNRSNMYQCINSSKCISIYRLMDAKYDCPHMDDENIIQINNTIRIEDIKQNYFICPTSNKYISQSLVGNIQCDCGMIEDSWCDDEDPLIIYLQRNIIFQCICDGFIHLLPEMIGGKNETDETECEQWECNNIYTHCNKEWNCRNGADETGCFSYSTLNCSSNYHYCVSPYTNKLVCLPIVKANDGHIDCLGATDEPTLCIAHIDRSDTLLVANSFYCINQTSRPCINNLALCDGIENCQRGDDEQFCHRNRTINKDLHICPPENNINLSDVEKFLCKHLISIKQWRTISFKIDKEKPYFEKQVKNVENTVFSTSLISQMSDKNPPRCHRGLDLRVWSNNLTKDTCLCPSSFYGEQCQYQNQRISLSIQFRALSDSWQTFFTIVISLIDNSVQRIIHSYEQMTYFWVRDCKTKFHIYLLYATRPKDPTKNYSIHIDIYEKVSLKYRGSLLLPVNFSFLPVHRLAFYVDIPRNDEKILSCSKDCIHGKCIKYSNKPQNDSFCQCEAGWSGQYCTIQYICNCASDLSCIGVSTDNRSICVCPMNKFGPRCLLTDTVCQTNNNSKCQNRGECIPSHDYMMPHHNYLILRPPFICVCQEGFSGDKCEIVIKKVNVSFAKDIVVSQSIFLHFIHVTERNGAPTRATTFRSIPVRQDSIIIHWSERFHLAFVELHKQVYYLAIFEKIYNESTTISKMIQPADRCLHINELFNETLIHLHPLRRIKYYHLLCQKQSLNLSCFFDDVHLCLCYDFGEKRLANCLKFDHNMKFDCSGQSECENDAQCFQDKEDCPTRSICMCPRCFYGRRCQFSTIGFGLSLDGILGYHILPHLTLTQQPIITQMSLALTIIFVFAGLIDGILCIITFKNKIVREIGCGLYLLGTSMTTLLTMIMFGLKFLLLLLTQMTIISNQSFLSVQCHSIDFILRVCLTMNQWLNACVAMERAITTIKGVSFDKKKSKQRAKFVIIILLIVVIGTSIHDPIYRRVIDEVNNVNEKRIWCIISYPSSLQVYNYIIHIFHFLCPFTINFVSAIIVITKNSRQQAKVHKHWNYKQILREQFQQHRHLLTAPIVLVILALPRLIIVFVSKCMESANSSWLFLIGYFISFIPSMLTCVVFILPSNFYKKELRKSLTYYRTIIQRHLCFIS